jgi:hypothetical protein
VGSGWPAGGGGGGGGGGQGGRPVGRYAGDFFFLFNKIFFAES